VAQGHDVRVVTRGSDPVGRTATVDGVRIVRAAADPLAIDFTTESLLAWSQAAEHALLRAALPLVRRWRPDVVHAHDWLVAQSAVTLAQATRAPLVATLHATEAGRHQGRLPQPLNVAIDSVERWLVRAAVAVITCSTAMHDEVTRQFAVPVAQLHVIPNGIDARRWTAGARARGDVRSRLGADGPLLVFAGRLMHEKGVETLLRAVRPLRDAYPGLRLVVAGTGLHEPALRALVRQLRITRSVEFVGFVAEPELPALFGAAGAVVVPSLYEPFGIVALEAACAGAPLVVAETGGLRDLAAAGIAVASFPPGDVEALCSAVGKVLVDPAAAQRAAARARRLVRRDYTWGAVARRTADVYAAALVNR
jgi:glycogen(starch) synthase